METSVQAHWLGHSAFKFVSPKGNHILVDPFLKDNPTTPDDWKKPDEVDYILITHGHEDHVGDTLEIAERTGCTVVAMVELARLFMGKYNLPDDQVVDINKGGTVHYDDFSVTMVSANHSASFNGDYAGDPGGLVISFEDDICIYHMGDTNIFADLEFYGQMYQPHVCLTPMGDHYTMGPQEAAYAIELVNPEVAIPIHYGTFPPLTGSAEDFKKFTEEITETEVWIPEAGEKFLG